MESPFGDSRQKMPSSITLLEYIWWFHAEVGHYGGLLPLETPLLGLGKAKILLERTVLHRPHIPFTM